MSVVRQFECINCNAKGKIVIKGSDITYDEIATCPVCGCALEDEDDSIEDE